MIHSHSRFAAAALLVAIAFFLLSVGCGQPSEITRYEVPKDRSGLEHIRDAAGGDNVTAANAERAEAGPKSKDRMVVAIAERDDATWFFKLTGPVDQVNQTEKQWRAFLQQVKFNDAGKPTWELPADWSTGPGKPMRFATLTIGQTEPPLSLAVSSLSAGQDMLLNVNRWRGQLGLEPTTAAALKSNEQKLIAGSQELTLFDEIGRMSGSMMGPFAGGPTRKPPMAANNASASVKFDVPDGWQRGAASMFLKAKMTKSDSDRKAQISVSSLPAAANEWQPNVQRWAGQVGLSSLGANELAERTDEVTVAGIAGQQIRLIPESSDAAGTTATIAVMVKRDSLAWFFKLTGDAKLVAESDADFAAFLKSVRFE